MELNLDAELKKGGKLRLPMAYALLFYLCFILATNVVCTALLLNAPAPHHVIFHS